MIALKGITKTFDGRAVLNHVNFQFEKNHIYFLKGDSGIGKTTLLNIISGYLNPDFGEVSFSENEKVDYMFQEELLFSNLSVMENMAIKYFAQHQDERWNISLVKEKSAEIIKKFALEGFLDRKVNSLSGGERQRIILANMTLSNANVFLLDEPVANLDEENRARICALINTLTDGRIIIIVSHLDLPNLKGVVQLRMKEGVLLEG